MFDLIGGKESIDSSDFADKRLLTRYERIKTQLELGQSSIMNQLSNSRAERKGSYDFFKNTRVSEAQIKSRAYEAIRTEQVIGANLLVLQDTTEYNYAHNESRTNPRLKDSRGLGDISSKYGLGYFAHPSIVINQSDNSIVGLSDLQLWHRASSRPKLFRSSQRKFEDKESYKWHVGIVNSHKRLAGAKQVTYVQDRDGDAYESIVKVRSIQRAELLVRSCQNRRIQLIDGSEKTLYDYLLEQEVMFTYELGLQGDKRKNRSTRVAQLEVRSVRVNLVCPRDLRGLVPPNVEVDVVWVRERASSVPQGESPVDWKLITTHQVAGSRDLVEQLIEWYASRWKIEEFFLSPKQEHMIWKTLCWKRVMVCVN